MDEVAIYIRTSTTEQNPQNQLKDCLKINTHGHYQIYEDRQSAWKEGKERTKFEQVKQLIKKRKLKHLIVWDLDRIYRNRKNLVSFFELCKAFECKIHSVNQKWLSSINNMPNPWNEIVHDLMIQIMGWLAQDESDKKSKRVKAAIRKNKKGITISYKGNIWGRKKLSKIAKQKIIELYKQGISMRQISKTVTYVDRNKNYKKVSLGTVHKTITEYQDKKRVVKETFQNPDKK